MRYIRQYTAVVDREKAGYDLLCFIHISLQMHQVTQVEKFREATRKMPEVLECHHITGEYDYLLKVVLRNRKDLESFVVDKLTPIPGVARIHTSLVLTEVKSTMALPLEYNRLNHREERHLRRTAFGSVQMRVTLENIKTFVLRCDPS